MMPKNKKILKTTPCNAGKGMHAIALLKPTIDKSKPMLAALKERKTTREIGDKKISPQMLSNLLWAA